MNKGLRIRLLYAQGLKSVFKVYMKFITLVAAISCVMIVTGCDNSKIAVVNQLSQKTGQRNLAVDQSLRSALLTSTNAEAQVWREFLGKWPHARQGNGFAWYEDEEQFRGNVTAGTLVEDRYVFKAILDFQMNSNFSKVSFPKVRFQLSEVKRVVVPPNGALAGGVSVLFQPNTQWLGLTEWKQLVGSNWDFSAVGITIISNTPIRNIQAAISVL